MFDRIIVSCDDSHFKYFWIIVSKAWKKYYPDKKISLAFVTNRDENNELVLKMKEFGDVHLFPVIDKIPVANQAKMARHILAGEFGNEVCMIEDIDTIPLQTDFIDRILSQRPLNKLLLVGSEVYKGNGSDEGKIPISNITGESFLIKKIVNPKNLNLIDLYNSWTNIEVFDKKEAINNEIFSDESLWRVLLNSSDISKNDFLTIERNVNVRKYWIDRSWWNIDIHRLKKDDYVVCNFPRPFLDNLKIIEPIIKHIFGHEYKIEDVLLD